MIASNKQQEALTQEEIDAVLQEWRQGDFVLGNQKFIRRVDTVGPITQSSLVVGFSDDSQKQLPNWLKGWFLELWSKTFQSFTKIFNLKENIKEDHVNDFSDLEEIKVRGLVVVTQTCDILRTCSERPFVEVVPLKEVDETYLCQIQQSMRPQYAFIPGSAEYSLAADLDCVMTLEKAVVARWQRHPYCISLLRTCRYI